MKKKSSRQNALKRVLVIHAEGNSFSNPSMKCIIDLLLERGCEIDLRHARSAAPMPAFYEGIRFLPWGKKLERWKFRFAEQLCSWPLVYLMVLAERILYYGKYDLIIGVDRQGLIEASALSKMTGTPYVYISFEIMFEAETSVRYKSLEKEASRSVAAWIIQDEVRAGHLQRENLLDPSKKILLPVASTGVGAEKKERLRDHLGISREKKVVIVIGSMAGWSMTSQLMKCTAEWPEEWVLIVHYRYGRTSEILAGERSVYENLLGRKIFISEAATDKVDDMGGILAGVSAGLAFYKPEYGKHYWARYSGRNLKYLGLSSGKVSTYLRYGVPVIINEVGLYAEELRKFRFGCVVERPELIKDSLEEFSHEEYRQNAREYFLKKLDFSIYRDELWSRFETLAV